MSPSYITRHDGEHPPVRRPGKEASLEVDLRVVEIRVRFGEVALIDQMGRESVLITRGDYAGAGMMVDLADHLPVIELAKEPTDG